MSVLRFDGSDAGGGRESTSGMTWVTVARGRVIGYCNRSFER